LELLIAFHRLWFSRSRPPQAGGFSFPGRYQKSNSPKLSNLRIDATTLRLWRVLGPTTVGARPAAIVRGSPRRVHICPYLCPASLPTRRNLPRFVKWMNSTRGERAGSPLRKIVNTPAPLKSELPADLDICQAQSISGHLPGTKESALAERPAELGGF